MALAFGVVTVLYCGLAAATIAVTSGSTSRVPLADLIAVGFGRAGRDATAVLAVALTMGTMNVYVAGASKLIAALALEGALPPVLAGDSYRSVPRRPLVVIAVPGVVLLGALVAGFSSTDALIRATSACFIGVYVLALLSAVRILVETTRVMAAFTFVLVMVLAAFSGWYLAVPVVAAAAALAVRALLRRESR
jgi:amino acid efflux transporter